MVPDREAAWHLLRHLAMDDDSMQTAPHKDFIVYFGRQWIGTRRPLTAGRWSPERIRSWNVHERLLRKWPLTSNAAERLHKHVQAGRCRHNYYIVRSPQVVRNRVQFILDVVPPAWNV